MLDKLLYINKDYKKIETDDIINYLINEKKISKIYKRVSYIDPEIMSDKLFYDVTVDIISKGYLKEKLIEIPKEINGIPVVFEERVEEGYDLPDRGYNSLTLNVEVHYG